MDLWSSLCRKAHDGDSEADAFIQLIQGCGHSNLDDNNFVVTLKDNMDQKEESLLLSLGFNRRCCADGSKYTLPSQAWKSFVESKRRLRTDWHEALQKRLAQKLKASLAHIREPLRLTRTQRLFLVQKFARDHVDDTGSIPFMRGLVGCLQAQLYKRKLVERKVDDYVVTQNGGVLGMNLVYQKEDSQDSNDNMMAITAASTADDHHYMVWRMNPTLSDRDLAAMLQCLPKQQTNQSFPLSSVSRPKSVMSSSSFTQRVLLTVFNGFIYFTHSIILPSIF